MRDPRKQADRLIAIRLRYTINTHLEDRGITAPSDIARAVGMPAPEAVRLVQRRQWREGDVAALREVAGRLGLSVDLDFLPAVKA
jgi:hypothetical protein